MNTPPSPNIEFHNAHLEPLPNGIFQICRYPRATRHQMEERGRTMGMHSCGAEIRFHSSASLLRVTLSCETNQGLVQVYRGPFLQDTHTLSSGVPTSLELTSHARLQVAQDDILESGGYSPSLWRIVLGEGRFFYHHMESFGYEVRPPLQSELPAFNWLAYGSSITHSNLTGYPFIASRFLHWNLFAKGLSGSCHIEPAACDYLAEQVKEHKIGLVTAELGINMRGIFSVEEFTKRAEYLIKTVSAALAGKPLVLISIFPNGEHYSRANDNLLSERQDGYDRSLRQLVLEANNPNIHLIEGRDLLPDFTLLSADLVHPTPSGHALMGHLLASRLHKILPNQPTPITFA